MCSKMKYNTFIIHGLSVMVSCQMFGARGEVLIKILENVKCQHNIIVKINYCEHKVDAQFTLIPTNKYNYYT